MPDLKCDGSLSWGNVKPGSTVSKSFKIYNDGTPGSRLDWEVSEQPTWGIWTFNPENGEGLTPEDSPFTVNVEVVAPDDPEQEFSGDIKIVNSENSSDFCIISVELNTPVNKHSFSLQILRIVQGFRQRLLLFR
jgi:hypothetical protein